MKRRPRRNIDVVLRFPLTENALRGGFVRCLKVFSRAKHEHDLCESTTAPEENQRTDEEAGRKEQKGGALEHCS